jgi:hypothetical protein
MAKRSLKVSLPFLITLLTVSLGQAWTVRAAAIGLTEEALSQKVKDSVGRVAEFSLIREVAEKVGVHVWLSGPSASEFGQYVRWDLQREAGSNEFSPDRFDYKFSSIIREKFHVAEATNASNSGLPLANHVVASNDFQLASDAPAEQLAKFRAELATRLPNLVKENPNFHVLSIPEAAKAPENLGNSLRAGLIELTNPRSGEPVVRDAKGLSAPSQFVSDLLANSIHFQREAPVTAESIKANLEAVFRYDIDLSQEDQKFLKDSLQSLTKEGLSEDQIRELNGLWMAAKAPFKAKKLSDSLGVPDLGRRLYGAPLDKRFYTGERTYTEPNLVPLEPQMVGQGEGKTAQELGLDQKTFFHATQSIEPYANLLSSPSGHPNAAYNEGGMNHLGRGFYSTLGYSDNQYGEYFVEVRLLPQAREGSDFQIFTQQLQAGGSRQVLLVRNPNAVEIRPSSNSSNMGQNVFAQLEKLRCAPAAGSTICEKAFSIFGFK